MKNSGSLFLVFILVLAAAVVGASLFLLIPDYEEETDFNSEPGASRDDGETGAVAVNDDAGRTPSEQPDSAARTDEIGDGEEEPGRADLVPEGLIISGRVTDRVSGEPVKAFELELERWIGTTKRETVLHETVRSEEGRFFHPLTKKGRYRIEVRTARHRPKVVDDLDLTGKGEGKNLEIRLNPGVTLSGWVVDDLTGGPVAGALVGPAGFPDVTVLERLRHGFPECCIHAMTDEEGRFALSGLDPAKHPPLQIENKWVIAAVHPDYAEGVARPSPGESTGIEIRLKAGFPIYGKVLDDKGSPAEGIMVRAAGMEIPMPRPVLTDGAGQYRTPPLQPGEVYLYAEPFPWGPGAAAHFTKERKTVRVEDRDLEVNFGHSGELVTWKGILYDTDTKPVGHAEITIRPMELGKRESWKYSMEERVLCDDQGRFTFPKLAPGAYKVAIRLPDRGPRFDWGKIAFDVPGTVEQDLQIAGAEIRGQVVDGRTGQVVTGKTGRVVAYVRDHAVRSFNAPMDGEGRFRLRGLIPGSYHLSVSVEGYPSHNKPGVQVRAGEIVEDLRIVLASGGTLLLKLAGFEKGAQHAFDLYLEKTGGQRGYAGTQYLDQDGTWEGTQTLDAGEWLVSLSFEKLGYVERKFEILEGRTGEVLIRRNELTFFEGTVSVQGSLTYSDGAPLAHAGIEFIAKDVPGLEKDKGSITGRADSQGLFTLAGFKPGRWWVRAVLVDGGEPVFPDLVIPMNPADPYPVTLILPRGVISGILVDRDTGLPLSEEGPLWWVFLLDAKTGQPVSELQGGHRGSRFELVGVPAGNYQLLVTARGYKDYNLAPVQFGEGQTLDVGELPLEPAGVLHLEVVNTLDEPLALFKVFCNGDLLSSSQRKVLAPGKIAYYNLPLGEVQIRVTAEGFKPDQTTMVLEPGTPADLRVVLKTRTLD